MLAASSTPTTRPPVPEPPSSLASQPGHHRRDNDDEEAAVSACGNELLADTNDDLNESDDTVDGHYLPDDAADDPVETESEIAVEVLFGESVLESFGGEDQVHAGNNLQRDVLKSMATSGWEDVEEPNIYEYMMAPYEPVNDTASYPGLRQKYSGPSAEALRIGDSPLAL
ncbi:hypothetical protein PC128_g9398 [Phytophthora cactorum]|nr:hypothetical protein PC128_g9398 [Phytophthora cactorum]